METGQLTVKAAKPQPHPGLTRVVLGGKLGQVIGKEWHLKVSSPREAMQAIDANTRGALSRYLRGEGGKRYYKIALQKRDNLIYPKEELANRSGDSTIYILPTVQGASAVGKIIVGAILVIAAVVIAIVSAGTLSPVSALLLGAAFGAGISLVLGGISQLLNPAPKQTIQFQSPDFAGNATAIQQGGPVPIVYGRTLVRPLPICVNFTAADYINSTSGALVGIVGATHIGGSAYQYLITAAPPAPSSSQGLD